ncbi:hypothetical protein PoB_002109000 [Plakobranchus ocellatus]|uniref:Uncharacterized protein n=1 Tax=Plakobranchus ocellatus TaxID=259542 RepID=A0AAV3ZJ47_9GAST|nr:hypothetical protein PoB_002109000 [Plakobranchus ocellatus]
MNSKQKLRLSFSLPPPGGVTGTVDSGPTLRSSETLLSRVRAPPPAAPRSDGGSESLRSPYCRLVLSQLRQNGQNTHTHKQSSPNTDNAVSHTQTSNVTKTFKL